MSNEKILKRIEELEKELKILKTQVNKPEKKLKWYATKHERVINKNNQNLILSCALSDWKTVLDNDITTDILKLKLESSKMCGSLGTFENFEEIHLSHNEILELRNYLNQINSYIKIGKNKRNRI